MQAFVTGASGFIGGHLVRVLVENKWNVRALVHESPFDGRGNVEIVHGDIRYPDTWSRALEGTDVLFHLAAALGFSGLSKADFLRVNARGTESLYQAAASAGVGKAVHVSSAGVIGAVRPGEVAAEDYPLNPKTAYDRSKFESEQIALGMAGRALTMVVVRPGWAYGPGDRRTFKVIKAIHDGRFAFVSAGRGRQTPVHIDDLVKGLRLAADKGEPGEIYHLAGDEIMTVREMAKIIAEACGVRIPGISIARLPATLAAWALQNAYAPFRKEAPLNLARLSFFIHPKAISSAKAARELGFQPVVDFKTGMAKAVAWYHENGWL